MGRTRDQKARKVEVSPLTVQQDSPCVTCPFVPELTHLSPMSSTPSLLQWFTSEPLPPPHGCWQPSLWLLCRKWMGSQDLIDIPAPPQGHPGGWKSQELKSQLPKCWVIWFSFTAVLIPMASVFSTAQNSSKACSLCMWWNDISLCLQADQSTFLQNEDAQKHCHKLQQLSLLSSHRGQFCAHKQRFLPNSLLDQGVHVHEPHDIATLINRVWPQNHLKVINFSL